jgi:hypothetical protein
MPQGRFHQDQSGTKIAMLTLLAKTDERTKNGSYKYKVRCDCGNEKIVGFSQMTTGRAKSCGCLNFRKGEESPNYKHGLSQDRDTVEYKRYQRECFDKSKYGLSAGQKAEMIKAQDNSCAICSYKFGQKIGDMHVDHCHSTGRVRGLLCDKCNRGLGYFCDSPDNLRNAAAYLAR